MKSSDIKVSDRLLSWVFDEKSEFQKEINNEIYYLPIEYGVWQTINIYSFIHLAKIKAFECGYNIVEYSNSVKILGKKKFYHKVNYNRFTVELTIEALEWVAEEVGGEDEG